MYSKHNSHQSRELETAIIAAKAGAERALRYYGKEIDISVKTDKSIVTIADKESEDIIKECILSCFPNAKFVAEESEGSRSEKEFWIIDPVDGSRNFSKGIPIWSALISLCRDGEIILGVCYYPLLDILVYAEKGKRSICNGKKLQVSTVSKISYAYVTLGSPKRFDNKQIIINLIDSCSAVRCPDSNYSSCLTAMGKVDAVIDSYGQIWDIAPFKVIIEEAGGKLTNWQGKRWSIKDVGYIATNGILHKKVLELVNRTT